MDMDIRINLTDIRWIFMHGKPFIENYWKWISTAIHMDIH